MKPKRKFLPVFIVAILVAVAMNMDYDDQQAQQVYYCEMTQAGHWPAFKDMECDQ